jgi:Ni,Fe-hydrogenase III large subunit
VGPAARASGLAGDTRRDHPYALYRELDFRAPARDAGDALARFEVRAEEIQESLNLVDQLILRIPGGPLTVHLDSIPAGLAGLGMVESPRGRLVHWLRTGPGGTVEAWRMRSASHANWPAVAVAALDAIVPDFPIVNKSFNLCYACADR